MNNASVAFTVEQITNMVNSVALLLDSVRAYINENSNEPTPESRASAELLEFVRPELVNAAYSQANVLIEVAADHLQTFDRVLKEPVQTISPWNCVRAVLETSAIAAWILDPTIDARARVSRSFAFRYEGLDQQLKFARACNEKSLIDAAEKRITEVEAQALALGFERVAGKRGKRIGIAERMPGNTEIVRDILDEEINYRLLSAITHAHPWALQQLSFQVIREEERVNLEKGIDLICVAYLCKIAVKAFLKPIRRCAELYGWDSDGLDEAVKPGSEILSLPIEFKPPHI
jgi:hypothetical protein